MTHDFIERRRHKRILTWRNTAKLSAVVLIAFVAISIRSELRGTKTREYGRIMNHQLEQNVPQTPRVEVVREETPYVADQSAPDPTLVEPMQREQWLYDSDAGLQTAPAQTITARVGDADVAIVGGPEGVQVVRQQRRKPVLSGGFGR